MEIAKQGDVSRSELGQSCSSTEAKVRNARPRAARKFSAVRPGENLAGRPKRRHLADSVRNAVRFELGKEIEQVAEYIRKLYINHRGKHLEQ